MIPPITLGQSEIEQNMVGWKNTFNMRRITLLNLAANTVGTKNGAKVSNQSLRTAFSVTNVPKSLDLLRKNLQAVINKDIENVIRKYLDKFFQPAINNIKNNLGSDSVTDENIRSVCRQILEDAKLMYTANTRLKDNPLFDCQINENISESNVSENKMSNIEINGPLLQQQSKRKESDLDVEQSSLLVSMKRAKPKLLSNYYNDNLGCKLSLKRDGPKWNPERIKSNTQFIMGSRANKVLGYGQTRGRLYVRHPNLLRYCGDQEDKEWLQSQNLLPANGGKIYIMLLDDIKELTESDEYKNNPNLQLQELEGFEAPDFMNAKIRNFLEYIKSEKKLMAVLDVDDNSIDESPPNVTISSDSVISIPYVKSDKNLWKASQLRQQIDYPNMSSDMSTLSSSVISSILAGTYIPMNNFRV